MKYVIIDFIEWADGTHSETGILFRIHMRSLLRKSIGYVSPNYFRVYITIGFIRVMVFNVTFNNISVISWRSVY